MQASHISQVRILVQHILQQLQGNSDAKGGACEPVSTFLMEIHVHLDIPAPINTCSRITSGLILSLQTKADGVTLSSMWPAAEVRGSWFMAGEDSRNIAAALGMWKVTSSLCHRRRPEGGWGGGGGDRLRDASARLKRGKGARGKEGQGQGERRGGDAETCSL